MKNTQTFVCAIGEKGAKHYLSLGTTGLHREDLESWFAPKPTEPMLAALDGMCPAKFAWVELERQEEGRFLASSWLLSRKGLQEQAVCRMAGRDMRVAEMADILVDEIRRIAV